MVNFYVIPVICIYVFSYNRTYIFLALSIDDKVGNLLPGKEFDALIIDLNTGGSIFNGLDDTEYTLEEKFQRFIFSGDDRNIVSVYISGRKVK